MIKTVYLDNSATTPICDEALEVYCKTSKEQYGNPSSLHSFGFEAEKVLNSARERILSSLSAKGSTAVFTASGSEANNLAIIGRAYAKERYKRGAKIITTEGEHASVDSPLERLSGEGFRIVKIPTVGGKIDMDKLRSELTSDVILVSMMMVNNETGALYDLAAVSSLMKRSCPEALLHADCTQSYLKIPFTKQSIGADLLTLSSHKIEGPKGVGALIIDEKVIKNKGLSALILGGGQEGGLRSGTENVPGVAAFAEAARIGLSELRARYTKMKGLRELLISRIKEEETLFEISPTLPESHAPHILNLTLPGIRSETMLHYLSSLGVYVSSGSACSSNSHHSSSSLVAYGRSADEADSSIRISLSHRNTEEDVDIFISALCSGIKKLQRK